VVSGVADEPPRTLAGAIEAIGADDVGLVDAQEPDRLEGLGHIEREVGVGVEDQFAGGIGEACLE
jgi:hypothetical protein